MKNVYLIIKLDLLLEIYSSEHLKIIKNNFLKFQEKEHLPRTKSDINEGNTISYFVIETFWVISYYKQFFKTVFPPRMQNEE